MLEWAERLLDALIFLESGDLVLDEERLALNLLLLEIDDMDIFLVTDTPSFEGSSDSNDESAD